MKARLPEGYGGGSGNMNSMIRQAQKMQEDIAKLEEEFGQRVFETTSGGGVVKVSIDGKKEIQSISIKPEAVDPDDVEMLEDLLKAALNEAIRTVEDTHSKEMDKLTGGLKMPGLI